MVPSSPEGLVQVVPIGIGILAVVLLIVLELARRRARH
jgi:hypothetical protein